MDQDIKDWLNTIESHIQKRFDDMAKTMDQQFQNIADKIETHVKENDQSNKNFRGDIKELYARSETNKERVTVLEKEVKFIEKKVDDHIQSADGNKKFSIEMIIISLGILASIIIGLVNLLGGSV